MPKALVNVVLGLQRGDEGKGRISDKLASRTDIIARYNGGPNAGHTIYVNGVELALHQVPAGVLYPKVVNIIGNGMYIDPIKLLDEIEQLGRQGIKLTPKNLVISYAAHLILPHHILLDELREGGTAAQGSTKAGIAYVAADKYERSGVRAELIDINPRLLRQAVVAGIEKTNRLGKQLSSSFKPVNAKAAAEAWLKRAMQLKAFIGDSAQLLSDELKRGKTVLAEGAQAAWLDIDGGMYPYVTSSHPSIGGALSGLRIGHSHIGRVIGVMKALPSHVGDGPFVTEIHDLAVAKRIRGQRSDVDGEFGATTGRPRRVGWLDLPSVRTAIRDNGITEIALTKLDALQKLNGQKSSKVCVAYKYKGKPLTTAPSSAYILQECEPVYRDLPLWPGDISQSSRWEDLPAQAKSYVKFIEKELRLPISMIGVGPDREQLISR